MKISSIKTVIVTAIVLLIVSCSPKIYRPPALGAEYQLDRGLPPAKNPSHLFDPKAEKVLAEKGMLPGVRSRKTTVATRKANTTLTPPKKQE